MKQLQDINKPGRTKHYRRYRGGGGVSHFTHVFSHLSLMATMLINVVLFAEVLRYTVVLNGLLSVMVTA